MHAKSLQSRLTLFNLMDLSLPGFFVHEILHARILEWVSVPFLTLGSKPPLLHLLHLQGVSLPLVSPGKPQEMPIYITILVHLNTDRNVLKYYIHHHITFRVVTELFVIRWTAACQASLSITNSWSLLKLMSIESVVPSNHLILWRCLLLPPSIFPSIRVISSDSGLCIRWPKYWSFIFSISLSNEYSGLISFMMDWLDLLAVQGPHKGFIQHHSSRAPTLQRSDFFIYSPTLTSIHGCWKNCTFDCMDLCWQRNVSAF